LRRQVDQHSRFKSLVITILFPILVLIIDSRYSPQSRINSAGGDLPAATTHSAVDLRQTMTARDFDIKYEMYVHIPEISVTQNDKILATRKLSLNHSGGPRKLSKELRERAKSSMDMTDASIANESTAMLEFQKLITADMMSQRSRNIAGRRAHSAKTDLLDEEGLQQWKEYCVSTALQFKDKGRLSIPVLEQRRTNPSSFKWSNTLYMTTPPSMYSNLDPSPSTYLKAYQERYQIQQRPALHEPRLTTGKVLGLKFD
jgi:hypothetical protein